MNEIIYIENLVNVSQKIEEMVETLGISYMEACVEYCQKYDVEEQQLGDIIKKNQNLKSKLHAEAEKLHNLKKDNHVQVEFFDRGGSKK